MNADGDVANENITVSSLKNGKYKLMTFHTWRGTFLDETEVTVSDGKIKFAPPYMRITGSQARYIGQDMAFILQYLPDPVQQASKPKAGRSGSK